MNEKEIWKDASMVRQKDMLEEYFGRLSRAKEEGKKVVYTFVPGNLTELIHIFDLIPVYPEINALQSSMRKKAAQFIQQAEKMGHSEDVCAYVKCDIGMMIEGNIGPTGEKIPEPDLLLLSYTGCFTFMKWFENLNHLYRCPVVMLHVPYQADGRITPNMKDYVVGQIKNEVIPALERVSGKRYDEDRLKEMLSLSAKAEEDLVYVFQSAKHIPSPIDGYFAAVYYIGPMFTAFRGTQECIEYYKVLRGEAEARIEAGLGPTTPEGIIAKEKYRLVVEGPPSWPTFREFWKIFYDEGAVPVASTYSKVGGVYDLGFRHDPQRHLETLADYCMGCYTNLNLSARISLLERYIREYKADGFVINSVKSCNSFSSGQLLMMRELEKRTGLPGSFIESDVCDPRYFSHANIKNRLESYLQMIDQKKLGESHL